MWLIQWLLVYLLIRYFLETSGSVADTFYVDDRDGRVILRRKVNAGDSYTMLIRASDGGSPPQNGTVYVTVNVISSQGELSLGKHNLYITLKVLLSAMYINVIRCRQTPSDTCLVHEYTLLLIADMCVLWFYVCNLSFLGTYFIRLDEDQPTQETIATLRATPGTNIIYGAISSGANNMWDFFMVSKDVPSIDVIMNQKTTSFIPEQFNTASCWHLFKKATPKMKFSDKGNQSHGFTISP